MQSERSLSRKKVWVPLDVPLLFAAASMGLGSLTDLPHAAIFCAEYIISAGQDALVQLWPLHPSPDQSYGPEFVLAGHTSNVCCLDAYDAGPQHEPTICSGSWDCTAIIWRNNLAVFNLRGHSAAMWAVLGLGDAQDSVLTAGADNLIMLW